MEKEWFEKHVRKCTRCGSIPMLIMIRSGLTDKLFGYQVYCDHCGWDGEVGWDFKTFRDPVMAIQTWNWKMRG